MAFFTLLCRHNLTLASDVCEAALRSLFRTLNELNELPDLFGLYVVFSQFNYVTFSREFLFCRFVSYTCIST